MSNHTVYASTDLLEAALGVGATTGIDDQKALALVSASRVWDRLTGEVIGDDPMTSPYTVTVVPRDAQVISAVIKMAVRFYREPDAVFGIMAAGDIGVAVRQLFPDMGPYLLGQRRANAWGIA